MFLISCDLAGVGAVVAGALLAILPQGSHLTRGLKEGAGQPHLPAACIYPTLAPERLCKRCVELQGLEGLAVPLALELVLGLHFLPPACPEHRCSLPLPARLWHTAGLLPCGTPALILCHATLSTLPCPAFLSHPWLAFRALNLAGALLAVLGLAVWCLHLLCRAGRRGQGHFCCDRAPLLLPCSLSCAWQLGWEQPCVCGVPRSLLMYGWLVCALAALHPVTASAGCLCASRGEWVAGTG